jgi:hypothetical protein
VRPTNRRRLTTHEPSESRPRVIGGGSRSSDTFPQRLPCRGTLLSAALRADARPGRPDVARSHPALWVDLDALDHNIATMAERCAAQGVDWRPHVKASKAPDLAKRLIAGGAVGITCAKVGEAEVMAAAGVTDILIANEIVGPRKIARLVEPRPPRHRLRRRR